MTKCFEDAWYQAAFACDPAAANAAAMNSRNNLRITPPLAALPKLSAVFRAASSSVLEETVRIDVDADPDLGAPFDLAEPVADDVLDVEAPARVDEEPLAVA